MSAVGIVLALGGALAAWRSSMSRGGYYDREVYGMTPATHLRYAVDQFSVCRVLYRGYLLALRSAGIAALALYALLAVLYLTSFLRGAANPMSESRFSPRPNRAGRDRLDGMERRCVRARRGAGPSDSSRRFRRSGATGVTSWTRRRTPTRASSTRSTGASCRFGSTTTSVPTSTPATTWAAGRPRRFSPPKDER